MWMKFGTKPICVEWEMCQMSSQLLNFPKPLLSCPFVLTSSLKSSYINRICWPLIRRYDATFKLGPIFQSNNLTCAPTCGWYGVRHYIWAEVNCLFDYFHVMLAYCKKKILRTEKNSPWIEWYLRHSESTSSIFFKLKKNEWNKKLW